jgi:pimeloyl-ACP methyl ester carboxylesterase
MKTSKKLLFICFAIFSLSFTTSCNDEFDNAMDDLQSAQKSQTINDKDFDDSKIFEHEKWVKMKNSDIKTNYFVSGYKKSNVDIILIHGLATNRFCWLNQVEYFKTKARVININLPYVGTGYVYNTEQEWTFELLADAVYSVMEKEKSSNAVVIGHSSGYAVGKELAIKYPSAVSKLVNVDFNPFAWPPEGTPEREAYISWLEGFFLPSLQAGILKDFFIESMCPTNVTPIEIRNYLINCMESIPKTLSYKLFYQLTREELWLPKPFEKPVLSIHVAENPLGFINLERIHPNIVFEVVPFPSGHFIQMEHPNWFNQAIDDFVFDKK